MTDDYDKNIINEVFCLSSKGDTQEGKTRFLSSGGHGESVSFAARE